MREQRLAGALLQPSHLQAHCRLGAVQPSAAALKPPLSATATKAREKIRIHATSIN
ncbi:MAG: hypothetical protein U5L11_04830 [Arhodomonas sp.]|nr:hypothetical protein [Arhodomonas sp.]